MRLTTRCNSRCPHAWQNVLLRGDVNNNGNATAGDALIIINELSRRAFSDPQTQWLRDPLEVEDWPALYFDRNGDDKATALDALLVINDLARNGPSLPTGEGEQYKLAQPERRSNAII